MFELINRVNWIDVFILILLIRISYVSSRIGVGKQILPYILLVLTLTIPVYYYRTIASLFVGGSSNVPSLAKFFSYWIIVSLLFIIYRFILNVTGVYLALQANAASIERVGGTFLGALRSFHITGIILIGLLLMPVKPVVTSVINSYSGLFFVRANLKICSSAINSVYGKEKISYEQVMSELVSKKSDYLFESFDVLFKKKEEETFL